MTAIRVTAMLEAQSVTGSAKAVLEFAKQAYVGMPRAELSVITFCRNHSENGLTTAIRDNRLPLDVIYERGRFDLGVLSQLRAVVADRRPNLIWSNSVKSHFLVRFAGLNQSCRWVAFHHGYTTTDLKMRIYNQLDRWSLRAADRVVTSCRAFVEELIRMKVSSDRIDVERMPIRAFEPVSEERKSELRGKLRLDKRTQVLLSVGRLSHEKGHADLIWALPKIRKLVGSMPLHVVLVGEGPERPRIERLCRTLQVAESVTLVGQVNDVSPYYAIADVFVLPSLSEGSPNVLLEAVSAGVPVVATAVGGVPELLSGGKSALLVERQDVDGLARAANNLLTDDALRKRLVTEAYELVSRQTPAAYFQSMASIFERALQ